MQGNCFGFVPQAKHPSEDTLTSQPRRMHINKRGADGRPLRLTHINLWRKCPLVRVGLVHIMLVTHSVCRVGVGKYGPGQSRPSLHGWETQTWPGHSCTKSLKHRTGQATLALKHRPGQATLALKHRPGQAILTLKHRPDHGHP